MVSKEIKHNETYLLCWSLIFLCRGGILGLNCGSLPLALELLPCAARIGFTFRCSKELIRFGIFRSGGLVFRII